MSHTDMELLARYSRGKDEDAFGEIVQRHLNLIYSAALRQVRSPQLAEEVAQCAFLDLARQAHRLRSDTILAAWLYKVTRRTSLNLLRREARRQLREQIACDMNTTNSATQEWIHVEPLLDEAMQALDERDRAAVLLRYFENKTLREVGQAFGISDDTAQKRVSRAEERLRELLMKRGITTAEGGLVAMISAHAVQTSPMGLGGIVLKAATEPSVLAQAALSIFTGIKLKIAILALLVLFLAGASTYHAGRNSLARLNLVEEVRGSGFALARDSQTGAPVIGIVVPGTLPARAGLTQGLILQAIDGVSTTNMTLPECVRRIDRRRVVQLELFDPLTRLTNIIQYTHGGPAESMGGIGIALGRDQKPPATIMAVHPGLPAEQAGLSKGFIIHAIDGVPTAGMNPRECLNRIQGPPGTIVQLHVIDPTLHETNAVQLTRRRL